MRGLRNSKLGLLIFWEISISLLIRSYRLDPAHRHQVLTDEVTKTIDVNLEGIFRAEWFRILRYALVSSDCDVNMGGGLRGEEVR